MAEFTKEELEADAATFEDTQQPEPEQQRTAEPARDEQGRFAQQEERDNGQVPYQALKSERHEHRETKEQLKVAQERLRQIDEWRLKAQQQPQQTEIKPEPEQDPTGIDYLSKRMEELEKQNFQRSSNEAENVAQSERNRVLSDSLVQSETEFRQQTPDYDAAAQHLAASRAQELSSYGLSQQEIADQLAAEVLQITDTAINMGRSPAELAYQIAQTRGYQPAGKQQSNATFEAIARGQKSKNFGGARGSTASDPNANQIANMSEEEFFSAMRDPEFAKLVGTIG